MSQGMKMLAKGSLAALAIGLATTSSAIGQEIDAAAIQTGGAAIEQPMVSLVDRAGDQAEQAIAAAEAAERERQALEAEIAAMAPGDFIWRPERATSGPVQVVVSIEQQRAYVFRASTLIGATTISSGRRGHETPTGSFPILQKNRRHFSNLYNNAPMPNMQRLTWDGIALHAGALPGYPASHGCIRLPMEFSRLLFAATRLGDTVHVVADAPPTAMGALQFATGEPAGGGLRIASAR